MSLPHQLRLRPDLIVQPHDSAAGSWVVKDPITLRYFLFGADEQFILERLDGRNSADKIIDDFGRERAPRRMTPSRLHAFLSELCRSGLASSTAPGQEEQHLERDEKLRRRERIAAWTSLLAIKFPGVDPDAWLDRAYPAVRWMFAPWFLLACLLLCVVAAAIAVADRSLLWTQTPDVYAFFGGGNIALLALALAGTKVLHELAHAFACKHFGGRCHEIGLMLLVVTPCLYCDVSDAWMLRSRWKRIAISAAGILAEFVLAAIAVIVWRYTVPGTLNSLAFNVVAVCGIGTLLFNGNPLLKYDGYYVLSDLVGVPNLWQESRAYFYGRIGHWLLGRKAPAEPGQVWRKWFLVGYAVASIAYRACLLVAIYLFLHRLLTPLGLELVLALVAASVCAQFASAWAPAVAGWWRDPSRVERVRTGRVAILLCAVLGSIAAIFAAPLPCNVTAPLVLQPTDAHRIYVATPGVLRRAASPYASLAAGESIAELDNAELEAEKLRIEGEVNRIAARVESLESRQADERGAAAQLLVAREILADLKEQARLRGEEIERLTLRAPAAGTLIPAARVPDDGGGRRLPRWSGSPLDPVNRGCFLEQGAWVCSVGTPELCHAVAYVDEADLTYVRTGQSASIRLSHDLANPVAATVIEIGQGPIDAAPQELAAAQDIPVRSGASNGVEPIRSTYQVRLEVSDQDAPLLIGARGVATIQVEAQSAATRLRRWIDRTWTIDQSNSRK